MKHPVDRRESESPISPRFNTFAVRASGAAQVSNWFMGVRWISAIGLILIGTIAVTLSGCGVNIFDPIDSPSSDEQYLSAARACFDSGDLDCAKENYEAMAGNADVKNMELAFVIMEQQGITMQVLLEAIGNASNAGDIINRFAEAMMTIGADEAKREAIFEAYTKVSSIDNVPLRGFVRFVTSLALAATILAEIGNADGDGKMEKTDLVDNPTSCLDGGTSQCITTAHGSNACVTSNSKAETGSDYNSDTSVSYDTEGINAVDGTAGLLMLHGALLSLTTALSSEIGASGKFSSKTDALASSLTSININGTSVAPGLTVAGGIELNDCYRYSLINQGIGRD